MYSPLAEINAFYKGQCYSRRLKNGAQNIFQLAKWEQKLTGRDLVQCSLPKSVVPRDSVAALISSLFPPDLSGKQQQLHASQTDYFFLFSFGKTDSSRTQNSNSLDPYNLHPKQYWCCCFYHHQELKEQDSGRMSAGNPVPKMLKVIAFSCSY